MHNGKTSFSNQIAQTGRLLARNSSTDVFSSSMICCTVEFVRYEHPSRTDGFDNFFIESAIFGVDVRSLLGLYSGPIDDRFHVCFVSIKATIFQIFLRSAVRCMRDELKRIRDLRFRCYNFYGITRK